MISWFLSLYRFPSMDCQETLNPLYLQQARGKVELLVVVCMLRCGCILAQSGQEVT